MMLKNLICLMVVLSMCGASSAADIANLDDLSLEPNSYWNGSGGFVSGEAYFSNYYDDTWGEYWEGFAYSNVTDTETDGLAGQYNAITGGGQNGSANYAIGYEGWVESPIIVLDTAMVVGGLYVTNNNYAYYSMLNGDAFAKKFGGESGDDEDWFLLTITGKDANDNVTGAADFYLADYRFADNNLDYIVDTWEFVDLTSLGVVKSLEFSLSSSDVVSYDGGTTYYMNTPAYFAIDTIEAEPTALSVALQKIESARESKIQAIEAINAALADERAAVEALNDLLTSDELDDLTAADIHRAKAKITQSRMRQKQASRTLSSSTNNLEEVLAILTDEEQSRPGDKAEKKK